MPYITVYVRTYGFSLIHVSILLLLVWGSCFNFLMRNLFVCLFTSVAFYVSILGCTSLVRTTQ